MSTNPLSFGDYQVILRNDFTSFIERSFNELNPQTVFQSGEYIELLAATLEKCRTGQVKRLIINLPPRTLKSHAASVAFAAWLLGHDPSINIICASYGQDLADKHARDCRTLMSSPFYRHLFPRTVLSDVKQSVNEFMTTAQGFRLATSVGGALTGRGADVIILDDILKPEDALSESRRPAANDWYFSTLLTRLNSKENGVVILVMQRLHQGDLVGEVMDREPGAWEVLSLPAIALDNECYGYENIFGMQFFARKIGEALHPERDSVEIYMKIREAIGEYNFQSQYQQSPMSREGGIIKLAWINTYEPNELPSEGIWIQSWDTAHKAEEMHDYSVCTTWLLSNGRYYLVDVFRARLTYPELRRAVANQFHKFRLLLRNVLIEDRSSGIPLIQDLKLDGVYKIIECKPEPGTDKYMRLAAESVKFERGKVFVPKQAPWVDDFIRELTGFPGTKHDDQVDSTSQALKFLGEKARISEIYSRL